MNKKIKIIELFNKIANGEEVPERIKIKNELYFFNNNFCSIDDLFRLEGQNGVDWLNHIDIGLDEYVEILEDNTEEIEELPDYNYSIKENRDKINELVRAVNHIRKEKE